ncbi:hypothetical protein SGFS_103560 [Streptomyces graminofaciens]|uniref:Lipoprotein n=1 Tax=Streptomyces graminofaciens TaxID=68212 RepID=A0ABN5W7A3_9ACTN|nr:hypothetical protein [Streptomyces graminofaciens]BBC39062.1 hypothetical protein SGFS_103560 [Streptomyces graminofaciens]
MYLTPRKSRRRPGAVRAVVLGVCAAGALGLTGCSGDGGTEGADSDVKPSATVSSGTDDKTGASADTTGKKPGAEASAGTGSGVKSPGSTPASKPSAPTATGSGGADGADGAGDDCDHKMPISPDEIAVYRYTPEGGSLSLIVKHGNWGCGTPDSDGAPFETVGKQTYIPMDQAAFVTVTNPIVESTENQHIGVQEFLDWLDAHPDSGLVFTYHLGSNGAIDRLEEVFTP